MKFPNLWCVCCALLFTGSIATVHAEEADFLGDLKGLDLLELGQIKVSIATGLEQSLAQVPAVTTVITARDIENMGARNLDEVLQGVPGLHVANNLINHPVYTLRGISSVSNPEVLVLVNGIRLNNSQEGSIGTSTVWSGFPVASIARIEIIRGPGSAVYGADAFAGVINIITKQADEINGTEFGVRAGSFSTRDGWVLHGGRWNGFDIVATFEYNDTDDHEEMIDADAQTALDRQFGTDASLAPSSFNGGIRSYDARLDIARDRWRLRTGFHAGRDIESGVGVAEALDPNSQREDERFNADLTYQDNESFDNWELTAQVSYLQTQWEANYVLYPAGAFGGTYPNGFIGQPSASERHSRLELAGIYSGFDKHIIRLGAGYVHDDMYETTDRRNFGPNPYTGGQIDPNQLVDVTDTSAVFSPESARRNWHAFVQDTWALAPTWELTTGIRYDHYSDFGSTTNPRVGLVWTTTPSLVTKLLYGHAFRAPAFNELFVTNNPVQLGNPDLEPETIDTWELVFDYQATEDFYTILNLFVYQIEDKILYVPNAGTETLTAQNVGEWQGQGFEFEAHWHFATHSTLTFNYAYQDSEDDSTGAALGNAPTHQAYLRTDWEFMPLWSLHGQINWAANWERPANDPRDKVDDYATLDLLLRRRDEQGSRTNFAIGVRNLFDEDVRFPSQPPDNNGVINIPNDYPQAGRSFFAEFRYYF